MRPPLSSLDSWGLLQHLHLASLQMWETASPKDLFPVCSRGCNPGACCTLYSTGVRPSLQLYSVPRYCVVLCRAGKKEWPWQCS